MKQFFETLEDLKNEAEVIEDVCQAWNVNAKKLPVRNYKIDWMLFRGTVPYAIAEVKCRKVFYDPFLIGLHKFEKLQSLSSVALLRALVIVREEILGNIHWCDVTDCSHDGIRWMQDKRNREEADGEPCVALGHYRFKKL